SSNEVPLVKAVSRLLEALSRRGEIDGGTERHDRVEAGDVPSRDLRRHLERDVAAHGHADDGDGGAAASRLDLLDGGAKVVGVAGVVDPSRVSLGRSVPAEIDAKDPQAASIEGSRQPDHVCAAVSSRESVTDHGDGP